MTAPDGYQWRRDKDGLGVWEHRGKVAAAGVGHSPVDRRWDEVSMDKTLGAYSILACRKAMDDAGVTPDQIDGVICCDSHIAGGSGGSASQGAPRPYFAPPYDSERGLTLVDATWLIAQMRLPNVRFAPTGVPTISEMVGMAAQAVGDGRCHTCLVIYPTGNLEGRYRRGGENADDYARGVRCHPPGTAARRRGLRQFALRPQPAQALGLRPAGQCIGRVSLHDCRARPRHAAVAGLCAQSLTAQLQAAHHAG